MAMIDLTNFIPMAQSLVADGLGQVAAAAVLGGVAPNSDNLLVEALTNGVIAEAGSTASRVLLFGKPIPSATEFADSALFSGAFIAASSQAGLTEMAYETYQGVGITNPMVQATLANGLTSISGQFVRDRVREYMGRNLLTDPIATLSANKAAAATGFITQF